jgi:Domain of unknown function (DUF1707)
MKGAQMESVRASDRERDGVVSRLKDAFAEGRLSDGEFDERVRGALTASTRSDLDRLLGDLPPTGERRLVPPVPSVPPGRFAIAYKNSVRRAGRWRVPERYTSVVYKGGGWLDLRAAQFTAPVTTIVAVAYKSDIEITVPPGVRVEMGGFGVTRGRADGEVEHVLPPDAPVVNVRGFAYKGLIKTHTGAPER